MSYTAQDIIDGASQDLRSQLPSNSSILLDYVDRIHRTILRQAKWPAFMLSAPLQFITQIGVTDYWIGTAGQQPTGAYDTGLNLTNIFKLKDDTVLDRSNNINLGRVWDKPPNFTTFETPDGQSRFIRPTNFSHEDFAGLLQLWPAPNNQNTYQPSPEMPVVKTTAGGALAQRTYFVRYTIVDSAGFESDCGVTSGITNPTTIIVPAGQLLVVKAPKLPTFSSAEGVTYNQYNVYAATASGNERLQNGSPIAGGTDFTEANTGLLTNTAIRPTVNNITPMVGYLIEFRYWFQRPKITATNQTLSTPDDYKDILIAGVNWLGYMFLKLPSDAKMWFEVYQQGIREMIRDKNQFTVDFMKPDSQTQAFPPGIIPGFITGN